MSSSSKKPTTTRVTDPLHAEKVSPSREILNALRRIVRELRRSSSHSERGGGASAAQLFVLQILAEEPGASINDLAERTNTDQSSVSVVVQRLALARLIVRRVAPADRRRVELRLTPAGKRLIAKRPEPAQVRLFAAVARLTPAELRALNRGLAALVREMRITDAPPSMFFEDDEPPPQKLARRKKAGPPP